MTDTDVRQELSELAEGTGWHRRDADRTDYYTRSPARIHVQWQGSSAISGGALYQDDILMTYSRDLATVKSWFRR
jgi:hypothetical protein